ncbi:MAG: hypothetical protein ABII89_07810 [Candidatus Omnitrophota bacterium]
MTQKTLYGCAWLWLILFLGLAVHPATGKEAGSMENIAFGKTYTLKPAPNYGYCTEPGDVTQLTDGQYAPEGMFWTQKQTVGWSGIFCSVITINLGSVQPIRGASFSTAAGTSDVTWPAKIFVWVSADGKEYHSLGNLVSLSAVNGKPPLSGRHRYWTDQMKGYGRYVQFLAVSNGPYLFCDEIEVYRGDDAWLEMPLPEPVSTDPEKYISEPAARTMEGVTERLTNDLVAVQDEIEQANIPADIKARYQQELEEAAQNIPLLPAVDVAAFKAILPFNDLHRRIFAVRGAALKTAGLPPLVAWTANPWDNLRLMQLPSARIKPALAIAAMQNEKRPGALNLTNATGEPMTISFRLEGLPDSPLPEYLRIFSVEWTDTKELKPVATAILPAPVTAAGYNVSIPAGMTRQVWLEFKPETLNPGQYTGMLRAVSDGKTTLSIPVSLKVFRETFPEKPSLRSGGWDYTNEDAVWDVTPQNVFPIIKHLQENYVNCPWATGNAMPFGPFNTSGAMTGTPSTENFDRWLSRWPGADQYMVYLAVTDKTITIPTGTAAFDRAIREWITFWAEHAKSKGIKPEQIVLLLVDEPHTEAQIPFIMAWANPIKAARTGIKLFTDPLWEGLFGNLDQAPSDLWNVHDIICLNRMKVDAPAGGVQYLNFAKRMVSEGREIYLYACDPNGKNADPYSYFRMQAWAAFRVGGNGSMFWSFTDTGGTDWNPYFQKPFTFSPLFMGVDSVTPCKQMESITEGIKDYEYLSLLKQRIAETENTNSSHPALSRAMKLLDTACDRVLRAPRARRWDSDDTDRTLADEIRIEIGEVLDMLKQP